MNLLETLVEALEACANDLAAEVGHRYLMDADHRPHPAMRERYERDMEPVVAARTALAEAKRWEAVGGAATKFCRFYGGEPIPGDFPALLLIQKDASHD